MSIRYNYDPDTGQPHVYQHGVTEAEVEHVLRHFDEDVRGRGDSRVATGQTAGGRYLTVIYVPDEDGEGLYVVTAYPLPSGRTAGFRRRRRKRKRR